MGEHEVTTEDGERRTKAFPTLRITGGPAGPNTHILLDGEEVPAVTGLELRLDVKDVARARISHIVDLDIEVEADVTDLAPLYLATGYRTVLVDDPDEPGAKMKTHQMLRRAYGHTEAEAILHLAYMLDDSLRPQDEDAAKEDAAPPPSPKALLMRALSRLRGGDALVPW